VRQLILATHTYANNNASRLPDMTFHKTGVLPAGGAVTIRITHINLFMSLLPYIEQEPLYKACLSGILPGGPSAGPDCNTYDCAVPGTSLLVRQVVIKVLQCPSDPGIASTGMSRHSGSWAANSYAANWQLFGTPGTGTHTSVLKINNIKDGSSNTIMFAERMGACQRILNPGVATTNAYAAANNGNLWAHPSSVDWYSTFAWNHPSYQPTQTTNSFYLMNWHLPPQIQPSVTRTGGTPEQCDASRPSTGHSSASVVGMGDGSVRTVAGGVSAASWLAGIRPEDGATPGSDWN
jgi:hypothetical protein